MTRFMETKDKVIRILDGVQDAITLVDWDSYQDLSETLEGVDLDFKAIMMLLRQQKVYAKVTKEVK